MTPTHHPRQIASVIWHQQGHHIEVIYVEGEPDRIMGAEAVAADLARSAGLTLVSTRNGVFRWLRSTDTWWSS